MADSTVPDSTVPDSSVPDSSIPDSSVPDSSVPDSSVPDFSVPVSSVLDSSVPGSSGVSLGLYEDLVQPDDDFRVLDILPGEFNDPINCSLRHVSQSQSPVFDAVSYTWGSSNERRVIEINQKNVEVTISCESVIRHLRHQNETTTVWIDALCINQTDTPEKNMQINRMREIYLGAAHVHIWLGEEDDHTELAFQIMSHISDLGRYDPYRQSSRTVGTKQEWDAVEKLFKREWFERIWVVQEASLAKAITVHCGHYTLSWTTFNRAIQWYSEDLDNINGGMLPADSLFVNAMQVRNSWATSRNGRTDTRLQDLLDTFGHWKATNLLDKVFALVGISQDRGAPELKPDYNKSIQQVYSSVVKHHISHDRRLDILGQCQNPPIFQGLSSWVPDWTPDRPYRYRISERYRAPGSGQVQIVSTPENPFLILIPNNLPLMGDYGEWEQESMIPEEMNFSASVDLLAEEFFPVNDSPGMPMFQILQGEYPNPENTMRLKGVEVDTVHSVTDPMFRVKEDFDDPIFFSKWEEFAVLQTGPDGKCPYGTFEERLDAFWRTISTDRILRDRGNLRANSRCRDLFEQWRAKSLQTPIPETVPDTNDAKNKFFGQHFLEILKQYAAETSQNGTGKSEADAPDAVAPAPNTTVLDENGTDQDQLAELIKSLEVRISEVPSNGNGDSKTNESPTIDNPISNEYEAWKQRVAELMPIPPPDPLPKASDLREEFTAATFEATVRRICFARKLARMTSGRLALVPEHARSGDKVMILFGGSVPYICRAKSGRGVFRGVLTDEKGEFGPPGGRYLVMTPFHQFIGEAYVHGIMDGEGLDYPSIQRTTYFGRTESHIGGDDFGRWVDGNPPSGPATVYKDMLAPLTPEQEIMIQEWRQALEKKAQDFWFE